MPRTIRPVPVEITSDKSTLVRVDVPCIIQGVNVKSKLDALEQGIINLNGTVATNAEDAAAAAGAGAGATTALSSSVASDLDTIRASIPTPGGSTYSVQYKASSTDFGGSSNFIFNPSTVCLTVGTGTVVGNSIQIAVGKYNTSSNSNALFVVGNGTSTGDRKDLFAANRDGQISFGGGVVYKVTSVEDITYTLLKSDYYIHANSSAIVTSIILPAYGTVEVGTTYIIKVGNGSPLDVELHWGANQYFDGTGLGGFTTASSGQSWRITKWKQAVGAEYWETW